MSRFTRKKWLPGALCIALGMTLAGCGGSSNHGSAGTPSPTTPPASGPTVTSFTPDDAATGVLNTATVSVTFDQSIDPATLNSSSFSVRCPVAAEPFGSVVYDDATKTATFVRITDKPTNLPQSLVAEPMPADVECTATVKAGIKGTNGSSMAKDFAWTFSTVTDAEFLANGQNIFRFDTFGDETQWTDTLRMNEVIEAAVDPATALAVGLKVDSEALPESVVAGITSGAIPLDDPQTTLALISLDAVLGIKGTVETAADGSLTLKRVGITCALCHSTVDDSFAKGIGKRLDGWPNRDLIPGTIIALSPALTQAQKDVYNSWRPGFYDPRFNVDGINGPVVIPPAYGLQDIHKVIFTGDGDDLAYWNRYVGVVQMGGHGNFVDERIGSAGGVDVTHGTDDLVSSKLAGLQAYQLSIAAPAPPAGSFDAAAAARGEVLFAGKANCASCHSGPKFTDANERLHEVSEVPSEPEASGVPSYASRSATKMYRTSPLRGVWQHPPYFHNGSAATLVDVVDMYNAKQTLGLTSTEVNDIAEYLKSL